MAAIANRTKNTTPTLPDYITYRFAKRLVYVKPAETYETAVDLAQKEFAELRDIPRELISFNTVFNAKNDPRLVRISESAWLGAVAKQFCGAVIDVIVVPDPNAPPTYLAVPTDPVHEEMETWRKSLSASGSPASSRQPSPSGRSTKSPKRSWLPRLA